MEQEKSLTAEELLEREKERKKFDNEEDKKALEDLLPKFEEEFEALCKKYEVIVEPFLVFRDLGLTPQLRIRKVKPLVPYDAK